MRADCHRLLSGNLHKFFDAKVHLLCQVYLNDYHVKWSVQKKSKATITIIKKLLHDFRGDWNVGDVL
jgi:hypothetical protein